MDLNKKEFRTEFAGRELKLSVSKMADQANSAVIGQYGDTAVLVTAVMGEKDRKELDYFPLSVDYEEKYYAAGKIIGSRFIRREGRPSENAVLSGRMIDRALRPLFDQRMRRDVQLVITILSYDEQNDPDFISMLTASTALLISDIPWNGPVAGLRLAKLKNGELVFNPLNSQIQINGENNFEFDAFVAGAKERINMIELMAEEAKENDIIEAFSKAQEEIKKLVEFQNEIASKIGKKKTDVSLAEPEEILKTKIKEFLKGKLEEAVYVKDKTERYDNLKNLKVALIEYLTKEEISDLSGVEALFEEALNDLVHKNILENEKRPDSRKLDEIRNLHAEVGLFKRLHGSALFTRGGTQALAVTTLAPPGSEQLVESMEISYKRRFLLHYNFPPYATGEIGRLGGAGRREIGHGALAEKALRLMIPSQEQFPYTIRVVSEILASNGSSSMATVCASTMSLMDAGVPIKKPVAGIAMGLITQTAIDKTQTDTESQPLSVSGQKLSASKYKILTDIQGPEDHYGDMDCKVAGTSDGVNAIQMDVKIEGIDMKMFNEILAQAKKARLEILEVMNKAISKPREKVSEFAPVVMTLEIKQEQIGEVIGPGGRIINEIIKESGAISIDIEQTGRIFVAAPNYVQAQAAIATIKGITKEFEVGEIVEGEIVRILDFGAIVDLGGGRDGMIHVSELKEGFVKRVEDVVKIGDFVRAKVIKVDNGKIGLSIKALL